MYLRVFTNLEINFIVLQVKLVAPPLLLVGRYKYAFETCALIFRIYSLRSFYFWAGLAQSLESSHTIN